MDQPVRSADSGSPPSVDHLADEAEAEVAAVVPDKFNVHDEASANWLIRKIVAARTYADRVKRWAEQEQHRARREEEVLLYLFGRQLEAWALGEIGRLKGRRKSVNLPAGIIGFRRVLSSIRIDDEKAVLSWARAHCPSVIVTHETVSRSELKAHIETSGEVPDQGMQIIPEREAFFVR